MTPRQRIALADPDAVVTACLDLLGGREADSRLVRILGGESAQAYADSYWGRVWAVRGLLWCWQPRALPALRKALADEHWRVREMAVKVAVRHELDVDATPLLADPVARVRAAAQRWASTCS